MKKSMFAISLALIMLLSLGVVAFAETPAATTASDTEATTADAEFTALQDALDAYRSAKRAKRTADLEAELKGYVESGSMTQEQADLILKYHNERQALRGDKHTCSSNLSQNEGRGGRGHMHGKRTGTGTNMQMNGGFMKGSQTDIKSLPETSPNV